MSHSVVTMISDLIAALPDPAAEVKLRRQLAREAYEAGRAAGWYAGREDARREMERAWQQVARPVARGGLGHAEAEAHRWHVCCRRCRLSGHRHGCGDCEDRTRETFGLPHRDDYPGAPVNGDGRRAA